MANEEKTEDKNKPTGLMATASGDSDFELTPEGVYTARCYRMIDLGTQESNFQGNISQKHKILITWELLSEPHMEDGRPFAISKRYTMSLHERSTLYKDLNAWRGKKFTAEELQGFDLKTIVGTYCLIQVTHNEGKGANAGTTYANIESIMTLPAGTEKPDPVNEVVIFDMSQPDWDVVNNLSTNLQEQIDKSPEAQMLKNAGIDQTPKGETEPEAPQTKAEEAKDTKTEPDLSDIPF